MAEKKVPPASSPKTGVQEPAGIAFDFENLIAAAVVRGHPQKASKAKNHHQTRLLLGLAFSARCRNALVYLVPLELGGLLLFAFRDRPRAFCDFIAA